MAETAVSVSAVRQERGRSAPQEEPATAATAGILDSVAMPSAVVDSTTVTGVLVIAPRLGARSGSRQSKAIGSITSNQANGGYHGQAGLGGAASGGLGADGGQNGIATPGAPGVLIITFGSGIGGGLDLVVGGNVTLRNTKVTGNHASTSGNDVSGTFHN